MQGVIESRWFVGEVELVLNWQGGELFIEAPEDAEESGVVAALEAAEAMGLELIEEMDPEPQDDGTVRMWLTPREGMEVSGWL